MNNQKEYLPANILFLDKNSINTMFVSLNQTLDVLKDSIRQSINTQTMIVLTNTPDSVNSYKSYKLQLFFILDYIQNTLSFKNIYLHTEQYLNEVINDIDSYKDKLKGLYVKSYGLCSEKPNSRLFDLYMVNTNLKVLNSKVNSIKPLELVIQTNVSCDFIQNISNTFGSELWLLDYLFKLSMGGVSTIVLEADNSNNSYVYNIYKEITNQAKFTYNIQNYYNIYNYKETNILVINNTNTPNTINLDSTYSGKLYVFTSISENSQTNLYYGLSKNIDSLSTNILTVEPKSATIFKILKSGGAYFEDINNEDEKNTIITVRPNQLSEEYDSIPTTMSVREFKNRFQPYM